MKSLAFAVLLALAGCTTAPPPETDIERLQRRAWATPWAECPGDWEAKPSCSCRNRALWLVEELRSLGHDPDVLVGYRDSMWPGMLHMVVLVEQQVIDEDGVHAWADYRREWRNGPEWYDWRIAHAVWLEGAR